VKLLRERAAQTPVQEPLEFLAVGLALGFDPVVTRRGMALFVDAAVAPSLMVGILLRMPSKFHWV
jgi:hypothetical protein